MLHRRNPVQPSTITFQGGAKQLAAEIGDIEFERRCSSSRKMWWELPNFLVRGTMANNKGTGSEQPVTGSENLQKHWGRHRVIGTSMLIYQLIHLVVEFDPWLKL